MAVPAMAAPASSSSVCHNQVRDLVAHYYFALGGSSGCLGQVFWWCRLSFAMSKVELQQQLSQSNVVRMTKPAPLKLHISFSF